MLKPLPLLLLVLQAALLACGLEEPTGPSAPGDRSSRPAPTLAAATLVGSTAVDAAGTVGWYSSLVSKPGGRQHVTYYDATNSALKYATCGSGCTTAANWRKVTIAGAGTAEVGWFTSLEVDGTGRRHVIYFDKANRILKYATCLDQANCTTAANWQKVTVDATPYAGQHTSLAVTSDGRRHVSYYDGSAAGGLKYSTCLTNCTVASSWAKVLVDASGAGYTSVAIGADGRRHISYRALVGTSWAQRYATCLTNCATAASWQRLTIDGASGSAIDGTSLAVDAEGVLHVAYPTGAGYRDLRYARCAADCTNSGNWRITTVDALGHAGGHPSIAVGANFRVHVSHHDAATGDLDYATCAADCLNPRNWTSPHIDGKSGYVGQHSSLALGGGLVHISYYDDTNDDLKYLELTP